MNNFKLGDIVIVIVDHPDGSSEDVFGTIGIISEIERNNTDFTVRNRSSDYVYGADQIRLATDKECRLALENILRM